MSFLPTTSRRPGRRIYCWERTGSCRRAILDQVAGAAVSDAVRYAFRLRP